MYEMVLLTARSAEGRGAGRAAVLGTALSFHAAILATLVVASAWQLVPVADPELLEPFRREAIVPVHFLFEKPRPAPQPPVRGSSPAPQPGALPAPPATSAPPLVQPTTADLPIPTGPGLPYDPAAWRATGDSPVAGDPGAGQAEPGDAADVAVQFGAGMVAPQVLRRVEPVYPTIALVARRQGSVVVEAEIDTRGEVRSARVVGPKLGFGLEESALSAVREWRFAPAKLQGRPVAVYFRLTVQFRLR